MVTAITEPPHLETDLKTLNLSTVAAQWRRLAEQAARQRQAPADFFARLAECGFWLGVNMPSPQHVAVSGGPRSTRAGDVVNCGAHVFANGRLDAVFTAV